MYVIGTETRDGNHGMHDLRVGECVQGFHMCLVFEYICTLFRMLLMMLLDGSAPSIAVNGQ